MGQIISLAAKPKRCNANQLSQVPTPAAGEHILVSSDNSMNAAGQGNFDCYIVGDGTTAASELPLHYIIESDRLKLTELLSLEVQSGTNLIDPSKYSNGTLLRSANPETNVSWSTSDFIPVSPNTLYKFVGINNSGAQVAGRYITWWAADKSYISLTESVYTATSPATAAYARLCTYNARQDYTKLVDTGAFEGNVAFERYVNLKALSYHPTTPYADADEDGLIVKKDLEAAKTELNERLNAVEESAEVTDFFEKKDIVGDNLINPSDYINGYYISNGEPVEGAAFSVTPFIEVNGGQYMTFFGVNNSGVQGTMRYIDWYDASKTHISQDAGTNHATSPSNAKYMRCSTYNATQDYTKLALTGAFYGSHGFEEYTSTPYLGYNTNAPFGSMDDDALVTKKELKGVVSSNLSVSKMGEKMLFSSNGNTMTFYTSARDNGVANYWTLNIGGREESISDDAAPMHIYNTVIGANHGFVGYAATIPNHGLTNTSVGTAWIKDGVTFYLVKVADSNTLVFISENSGTRVDPVRTILTTGTLTRNGASLTATSVVVTQVYPSIKSRKCEVYMNGILMDGDFSGVAEDVDIVESYDIMNADDVIANLVANVGSESPSFEGSAVVSVKNTYHINKDLSNIVIGTYMFKENVKFADIMFSQHGVQNADTATYFVPNSLPINGYDLRTPTIVPFGNLSVFNFDASKWEDEEHPVNRVIETLNGKGLALGYVPVGVGANLADYTSTTFSINGTTGKIYPHGVDSGKQGSVISAGSIFYACLYRAIIDNIGTGRYSFYTYQFNNATYIYADYSANMYDTINVDGSLAGCKVEVVESKNVELLTDIYNDGVIVKATPVSGQSCFIVLKVSE